MASDSITPAQQEHTHSHQDQAAAFAASQEAAHLDPKVVSVDTTQQPEPNVEGDTEEPTPLYFKLVAKLPAGVYDMPGVGHVMPGGIYAVRALDVTLFEGNDRWEKSSQQAFKAQDKKEHS